MNFRTLKPKSNFLPLLQLQNKCDDVFDMNDQDVAYLHTNVIKTPGKISDMAHCITIAPAGKVQPGKVVRYQKLSVIIQSRHFYLQ